MKLMHHKFIIHDRRAVWTGSLNLTNERVHPDGEQLLEIESADLAAFYVKDFEQLFEKENLVETGKIEPIRFG